MEVSELIIKYFQINLLLVFGAFILLGLFFWNEKTKRLRSAHVLYIGYSIISAVLILPGLMFFLPGDEFLAQKLGGLNTPSINIIGANTVREEVLSLQVKESTMVAEFSLQWVQYVLLVGFTLGIIFVLLRALKDLLQIFRIIEASFLLKKWKRVRILGSADVSVPFSFWIPGRAYVVLPMETIECPEKYKMAVFHELQHHRQRDTLWVHLFQALRVFFFFNPVVHWIEKSFAKIQEFACDEALVDQKKVSPQTYSRYLFEVASTAQNSQSPLVGATGMAMGGSSQTLKRRIEVILSTRTCRKPNRWLAITLGLASIFTVASAAIAAKGMVRDRSLSMSEANEMARVASQKSNFPIVVNDLVLKELNHFLGTPSGRKYVRGSLMRMENHREFIESKIEEYNYPLELLAMPFIESGFRNLPPEVNPVESAGFWQFIPSTARNYGLRVTDKIDDRLDIALSTDAAMRLLGANRLRFKDWSLSILAYGFGEKRIQRAMDRLNSRDPWVLVRKGLGKHRYLPKLMAAMLIIKNPEVLN